MNHSNLKRARIGWGKPASGPLPDHIRKAINERKATRSIYLGNIHSRSTQESLQNEFQRFGAIEQVRIVPRSSMVYSMQVEENMNSGSSNAFITFTDIAFAIKAVQEYQGLDPSKNGGRVVNYAKDRCAIPLRSW